MRRFSKQFPSYWWFLVMATVATLVPVAVNGCALHDVSLRADNNAETGTGTGNGGGGGSDDSIATTVLKLNNGTLIRIYENVSSLLLELGPEAQSLLVQLNQTATETESNVTALALVVLDRAAANDLLQKYRLYYVQLADDQTTGLRLYWKAMVDYLRGQMGTAVRAMWTPVSFLGRLLRYSNNSPGATTASNTMVVGAMPYLLKAVDLPDKMEHRILELSGPEVTTTINNNNGTVMTERLTMRPISAFNGRLPSASGPERLTLAKHGAVVTDKAVRILFLAEQLPDGQVDIFPRPTGETTTKA